MCEIAQQLLSAELKSFVELFTKCNAGPANVKIVSEY